ncbi:MAG: thiolase family protein [Actinomycetales bacterium]
MSATDASPRIGPDTPVVVAARRTAVATVGRGFADVAVDELAAPVLQALLTDLGPRRPQVDDVVLGNCTGPGGDVARVAALRAGLGVDVPGVTVDRQCGSGLEAIRLGAALVASGTARLVLAGGAESASTSPRPQRARFAPEPYADPDMGPAAETLAGRLGISRERQDAYAARSHRLALAARARGTYSDEIVPVADLDEDDRPRSSLTVAKLASFRPAFAVRGTVTAGNSCGINDGAAAVAIVSERVRATLHIPGLAVLASAVAGVDPALPGLGPVPAVAEALDRAGRSIQEVDQLEITEAFAAQVLACTDAWGLDPLAETPDIGATHVCPDGGAIALGHPWGASGALLVVRLFASMVRASGPRIGLATCAVGGGQGVAMVWERVG